MSNGFSRRSFIEMGSAAAVGVGAAPMAVGQAAPSVKRSRARPVVIASGNGYSMRNGGKQSCVEAAFERIVKGEDVLDALIAGVNIVELDPQESSVGYGGLPNADGVVQLDACCMHGPKKRAGGVAALEGVRTPSQVARAVMQFTDNHLIVGDGAQEFARRMGFEIEDDLNTEHSRKLWLNWKQRMHPDQYLDPEARAAAGLKAGLEMVREGLIAQEDFYGTINCNGVNAKGEVCGVTTTSGRAWKIPGRVGDSPILGAGLYVDGAVGAAGSTGRGESNLFALSSFLIVEEMRRGKHPKDAGMEALRRIRENTIEPRLLNAQGNPNFDMRFYILNASGEFAGVATYAGSQRPRYAVCTENGPEEPYFEALIDGVA